MTPTTMTSRCGVCDDRDQTCALHCERCGDIWDPSFIRVTTDPRDGSRWKLLHLLCDACWDKIW